MKTKMRNMYCKKGYLSIETLVYFLSFVIFFSLTVKMTMFLTFMWYEKEKEKIVLDIYRKSMVKMIENGYEAGAIYPVIQHDVLQDEDGDVCIIRLYYHSPTGEIRKWKVCK